LIVHELPDGFVVQGDCRRAAGTLADIIGEPVAVVIADPPYGNILNETWDRFNTQQQFLEQMNAWVLQYTDLLHDGGAFYIWGGYGTPGFRPFFRFLSEIPDPLQLANFITWSKKRAYGIQWGYLQTREDVAYLVKGDCKHPRIFNVPYLDKERGYSGYNPEYPARSKFLRRTSVWTDVTEILRGKVHPAQKPVKLHQIMIEASSAPGDFVVDPFAGSGTTALAARATGRRFAVVEEDPQYVELMLRRLAEAPCRNT
jgi:site-specific DNA-methyltransferase (adenine-specific)